MGATHFNREKTQQGKLLRRVDLAERVSIGQQLGNYKILRLLGTGGFAQVFLVEHVYLNTQAAVKVLSMQLGSAEREWFLREARTIARLVHPNIVRVLDFGIQDSLPFLVLDYAPNGHYARPIPKASNFLSLLSSPLFSRPPRPCNMPTMRNLYTGT